MHAYILLDRSGSMQSLWTEALSSVNAYAKELANKADGKTVDAHVTFAVFDGQEGLQFDVLRRKQPALHWDKVTDKDASPRGMTPLLDALIRIIALADADNPDKAVIVVMTDGQENASREVTRDGVKAALERVKSKGWEVVFLGANFDNIADASSVGVAAGNQMAMAQGTIGASMERLASKSRAYAAAKPGAAPIQFDAEDRKVAKESQFKTNKKN
ncbi:MAG TPA: vWA domain-containing protein [Hyphomonadaceae bacterium]|nr:vWA domain-containing protein [Hyphomonadaceae bacterium]